MSDPGTGTPAPADPNNPNPAPGAAPTPPVEPGKGASPFDPSKLSDDDLAKLYDDPRLYKHSRFKDLTDAQKELKQFKADKAKADEDVLKKKGEFETLAKQKEEQADAWKSKYTTSLTDNAVLAAASKAGIKDLDAALKLVDKSAITVTDDGKVEGVDAAIEALTKDKPYLLTVNRGTTGSPTNPSSPNTGTRYTMSQIQDVAFYRANEADIKRALVEGRVDEDRG